MLGEAADKFSGHTNLPLTKTIRQIMHFHSTHVTPAKTILYDEIYVAISCLMIMELQDDQRRKIF